MSTIILVLKSRVSSLPTNYCTIMVCHSLAKLYASILEHELRLEQMGRERGVTSSGIGKI